MAEGETVDRIAPPTRATGPLDDAWRQCAIIDEHIQQGPWRSSPSLLDKAPSFELAEIAVEADLAAEKWPKSASTGLAFHADVRVGRAHRRLLLMLTCIFLHFLLSLAFGQNQQAPEDRQQRHCSG